MKEKNNTDQKPETRLDNIWIRLTKNIQQRYDLSTKEEGLLFLDILKADSLGDIPYRIYLSRSDCTISVPGKAPTIFELRVQYPGHFYNSSMSKVFTDQMENENQRKIFWKLAKQKNRESSNSYKKQKRVYYRELKTK